MYDKDMNIPGKRKSKYGVFMDETGKEHEIPAPGIEAEDEDAYLKWLESRGDEDAINDEDRDDLLDLYE